MPAAEAEKSSKDTVCGPFCENGFPCRCCGGGGFSFLRSFMPIKLECSSCSSSSSSDPVLSRDVRGDSETASCERPYMECRDVDEASVLLLLGVYFCDMIVSAGSVRGPALPVISSLVKESTSSGPRPVPVPCFAALVSSPAIDVDPLDSIVASVLENGFGGAWFCLGATGSAYAGKAATCSEGIPLSRALYCP